MRFFVMMLAAAAALVQPLHARGGPTPMPTAKLAKVQALAPAPLSELVRKVDIPFERFVLPNGLTVIVHTDRKAPLVHVGVWYKVGSRDEPLGKGGFAHLFEHLMFYGSQHHDDEHFRPLEEVGATDSNGTTSFDRTNYFQTVPTPALDLALFLESDRMGWLLPAVTQAKLDRQRDVVKNEKREGDNQPFGQVGYALFGNLFPADHPYSVTSIGNPADLDAATLDTVRGWFRTHYGPNNAVLVLAGDIDLATARPLVERYFGNIPAGPTPADFAAPLPVRTETTRVTLSDAVSAPRLFRAWVVPGRKDAAVPLVDVALTVLADGATSRLYDALVRRERLAVGVSGGISPLDKASVATLIVDLRPGVDPAVVERRVDALLAEFLKSGASADEVSRVATRAVAQTVRGLERIGGFGGKGAVLAEGELYAGDPGDFRRELGVYAGATPARVLAAARQWLSKGDLRLNVVPGERKEAEIRVAQAPRVIETPERPAAAAPLSAGIDRSRGLPPAGPATQLRLPALERATLSNGIDVLLARVPAVPVVRIAFSRPGGSSSDDRAKPGAHAIMLAMLDEGSNGRLGALTGPDIARLQERLGASISASSTLDRTRVTLSALTPNLAASVALFADVIRAPAFPADQLERVRGQALAGLAAAEKDPDALAINALPPLMYGAAHPYGLSFNGQGTVAGVGALTRADVLVRHDAALRPEGATLIVVGDTTMAGVKPLLESAFGDWRGRGGDLPPPAGAVTAAGVSPRILLIDRPGAPQSVVMAGRAMAATGAEDRIALAAANDIFGGQTTARLNQSLREAKGWAYGASASVAPTRLQMPFLLSSSVQTDRTGAAIAEIRRLLGAFAGTAPPTRAELDRVVANSIRSLPGDFETGAALLGSLERKLNLGRPDDYFATLPKRLEALTPADVVAAGYPGPDALVWVVVGDATLVEPQLKGLGLPVERRSDPDSRSGSGASRPHP
ncbi:M16 family metallopeptidase [Sandaracinobacteroides saxicola]|uniref:Insulinase family protein n=1 Tax=Sandaracinobacteroides saxicola TaxID=2759707 RepID=A0A7G5II25_9SPHN|nr:pitrilysin family protein [Sandaracinobacteroides saxicola]QMW23017.1 insulinase family protein [Sandaracinobacteroides saxicola]